MAEVLILRDGAGNAIRIRLADSRLLCAQADCPHPVGLIGRGDGVSGTWEWGCPVHGPLPPPTPCPLCGRPRRWTERRGAIAISRCRHCDETAARARQLGDDDGYC